MDEPRATAPDAPKCVTVRIDRATGSWSHVPGQPSDAVDYVRADVHKRVTEALVGLISNIRMHQSGECPGITPADCLDAIYESARIASAALPTVENPDV